jgi:ribosomal protein RSM22 (predicted rRNA methylase)
MLGKTLVQPLEEDWRDTLASVARRHRWLTTDTPGKLAERVARLSRAYNEAKPLAAGSDDELTARLGFSFARDVPKSAGAVRELVATGVLSLPSHRALTVLDVGAGLGATTWGVARALAAADGKGRIDATWVDASSRALDLAGEIVAARGSRDPVTITARCTPQGVGKALPEGAFDLVLLGQTLSELDLDADAAPRLARHLALLESLLARTAEHGALVVVEPALRDRTRHLHALRDALLASSTPPTVFAPCLHAAPCPALVADGDWCHEDLDVDLPPWLVPVAKEAGLRWEGLTFSYLVLRRDAQTLVGALRRGAVTARVVSGMLRTKGKRELFLCGELGDHAGRVRAMRLDRHESEANALWSELSRGDVVDVAAPFDLARPRVLAETKISGASTQLDREMTQTHD